MSNAYVVRRVPPRPARVGVATAPGSTQRRASPRPRHGRVLQAALLVGAVLGLASGEGRAGGNPPPLPRGPQASADPALAALEVGLRAARPLSLVRWQAGGKGGLDGALIVTLANRGREPLRLRRLEVHGLLFRERSGQRSHVIVHSCLCGLEPGSPEAAPVELGPGQSRTIQLDEFGCGGGMWPAPPPGAWFVSYRALAAPLPPGSTLPPVALPERLRRCREDLASPAFWGGAAASGEIPVTLGQPKRRRIPGT
jgi:hypothetical protein